VDTTKKPAQILRETVILLQATDWVLTPETASSLVRCGFGELVVTLDKPEADGRIYRQVRELAAMFLLGPVACRTQPGSFWSLHRDLNNRGLCDNLAGLGPVTSA